MGNRRQFFEGGGEGVREAPFRSRSELLVFGLKVEMVNHAREVFWSLQSALHKRFIDDNLRRDVGKFVSLPRFYLLLHRLEV